MPGKLQTVIFQAPPIFQPFFRMLSAVKRDDTVFTFCTACRSFFFLLVHAFRGCGSGWGSAILNGPITMVSYHPTNFSADKKSSSGKHNFIVLCMEKREILLYYVWRNAKVYCYMYAVFLHALNSSKILFVGRWNFNILWKKELQFDFQKLLYHLICFSFCATVAMGVVIVC